VVQPKGDILKALDPITPKRYSAVLIAAEAGTGGAAAGNKDVFLYVPYFAA
jgi:hypothetical protein